MALINCPECGKEISDKAASCPNCGCPLSKISIGYNKLICTVNGVNGQLYLYGNRVVIKRKGALAKVNHGFFKGEKEIFLNQISGIQVKRAGMLFNGYIQFTLSGGNEGRRGIMEATKDENSVMFSIGQNKNVEIIKNKIYELKGIS